MNKQQLITLIDKLESISANLLDAVDIKSTADTRLLVLKSNGELLEVIQTLINHTRKIES